MPVAAGTICPPAASPARNSFSSSHPAMPASIPAPEARADPSSLANPDVVRVDHMARPEG